MLIRETRLRHRPEFFLAALRESHNQFMRALASDIQLPFLYGRRTVTITDQSIPYPIRSQKVAFHTDG